MSVGKETIHWLRNAQLQVDSEWSVDTEKGFQWWPDQQAQTIEVVGGADGPDGDRADFISVRTDCMRDVEPCDKTDDAINAILGPFASMCGPVFVAETGRLQLCSLIRVHAGIAGWMKPIISVAAIMQMAEARFLAQNLTSVLGGQPDFSAHPANGPRNEPDELFNAVGGLVSPPETEPSRWCQREFDILVEQCCQQPPSIAANGGSDGMTVEFPFGAEGSSLCEFRADQPHPRYGSGLLLLQTFPAATAIKRDASSALAFNQAELTTEPWGYGFGSYAAKDNTLHFTAFFPNAIYKPGFLFNLYHACSGRARRVSVELTGHDWGPESFNPARSAQARLAKNRSSMN